MKYIHLQNFLNKADRKIPIIPILTRTQAIAMIVTFMLIKAIPLPTSLIWLSILLKTILVLSSAFLTANYNNELIIFRIFAYVQSVLSQRTFNIAAELETQKPAQIAGTIQIDGALINLSNTNLPQT